MKKIPCSSQAFSLVEVVVAIGIVAFALLSVLGLFGSIAGNTRDQIDQRDLLESVDPLRTWLNETVPFDMVYQWVAGEDAAVKELLYVTYYADESGDPVPVAQATNDPKVTPRGVFIDPDQGDDLSPLELARASNWIKIRLSRAMTGNPPLQDWPANTGDYEYGHLVLQVDMNAVSAPEQPLDPRIATQTAVGVLRDEN